ncbi:DNA repair protein RecN [Furfurilactobacillus siliginis]|uniref:DNA repair protein RecN n=1 Tax=Furfurilactobacillus siliginis TaxID=348151 RepID=A0A0R2L5N9_9LACO|nr:DNA repair protein RecN [Furfurilactobacillus siliginis]KRN96882.1 DNA repair protein RecN [Furfurilactobacillus siliginis]GEK28078.1 DNA repair protein RecN [Furfurilactobacillus siliginis]
MLQELSIKNFAIIEALNIAFDDGMSVLTGETGAGKSIIIDAVGLLAGGRASSDFIRKGAPKATLQGLFVLPSDSPTFAVLDELGIEYEDRQVVVDRELNKNGHNISRVNGSLVNTTTLKRVGETMVDIHGQNEHQELMQPEKHLALIDAYRPHELSALKADYQGAYTEFRRLQKLVVNKRDHAQEWAQRLDMLTFQVQEIGDANLQPDEEATLNTERDHLANYQKIVTALETSHEAIDAEETTSALDQIGAAMTAMQEIADLDPAYQDLAETIANAYYGLQDATNELSGQLANQEFDEGRLDEIEARLEVIHQLKRKYGESVPDILSYYDKITAELNNMQGDQADDDALETQLADAQTRVDSAGRALSAKRQSLAADLEVAVHEQLKALYMDKAVFSVHFAKPATDEYFSTGIDVVEFYIQTNPGEDPKPLAKTASGGELSRMMLALKTIFSETQGVTSIIFDEVDTGVSGRVAQAIAEKIMAIGRHSQVLCITHLPQVAAIADHQFYIQKQITGKRTQTTITKLSADTRVAELARMLAGTTVTKLATEHASELLKLAEAQRAAQTN